MCGEATSDSNANYLVWNVTAHLVFNQLKLVYVTLLLMQLHCLSIASHIKSLTLTCRAPAGCAPSYLNNPVRARLPLVCCVPHMSVVCQSCLYRHSNPDYSLTLVHGGSVQVTLDKSVR